MKQHGDPQEFPVPTGLRDTCRKGHRDCMMEQGSPRRDRTGHRDCNGTDGTEESLGISCTHGTEG